MKINRLMLVTDMGWAHEPKARLSFLSDESFFLHSKGVTTSFEAVGALEDRVGRSKNGWKYVENTSEKRPTEKKFDRKFSKFLFLRR